MAVHRGRKSCSEKHVMNMPNVSAPPRHIAARVPHLPGMAALLAVSLSHIRDIFLLHATLFLLGERNIHTSALFIESKSLFYSFLVRVPYEAPVDSAEDIIKRSGDDIHRAHFCGSKKENNNNSFFRFHTSGGTFEKFFSTTENTIYKKINEMAQNTDYGCTIFLFIQ